MMYAKAARGVWNYPLVSNYPEIVLGHPIPSMYRCDQTTQHRAAYVSFYTIDERGRLRSSRTSRKNEIVTLLDANRTASFKTDKGQRVRPVVTETGILYVYETELLERLPV